MRVLRKLGTFVVAPVMLVVGSATANAAVVGDVVYQEFTYVVQDPIVLNSTFTLDTAGTYRAKLVDFGDVNPFDVLRMSIVDSGLNLVAGLSGGGAAGEWSTTFAGSAGAYRVSLVAIPDVVSLFGAEVRMVPIPAAVWLFGSALLGLSVVARRRMVG